MTARVGSTEYVQPIVVLRSGTHEDAVRAAALASVLAWVNTGLPDTAAAGESGETSVTAPTWQPWLAGRFAKSVRRAKTGQFTALAPTAAAVVEVGDAKAAAFAPTTYPDMAPAIAKLQVSGTDFDRDQWAPHGQDSGPRVLVNESLEMSTGKTAAQAAHGLFRWVLNLTAEQRSAWVNAECPFGLRGIDRDEFEKAAANAVVVIRDAGFTEIEPGSATVAVLP